MVRLYLSSFRMGDHPEHLVALAGQDSHHAVVIANAMDDAPPDARRTGAELELTALGALGFDAVELDLRGLELVDDADAVSQIYGAPPVWDGLAVLDEAFVPHYQSPGHPETTAIDQLIARYRAEGVAYRALHDGQALLVNGPDTTIV
jgi:dipeptidase E